MVAMWPDLERKKEDPRGSIDLGNGFLLLGPKDGKPYELSSTEQEALANFYSSLSDPEVVPRRSVYRWARLRLPTEQVARSYWKEVIRSSKSARTDRNLKVRCPDLVYVFDVDVNSIGSLSRCHPHRRSQILLLCDCCRN